MPQGLVTSLVFLRKHGRFRFMLAVQLTNVSGRNIIYKHENVLSSLLKPLPPKRFITVINKKERNQNTQARYYS